MTPPLKRPLAVALLLAALLALGHASAADVEASRQATADILFDMDIDNASFKVRHDGYVDIVFGKSLPDDRYQAAIERLKTHPDIPGILAGRGSQDYCPLP